MAKKLFILVSYLYCWYENKINHFLAVEVRSGKKEMVGCNASADGLGCFGWSSELHFPLFLLIMSEDSLILPQSVSAPVVGLIIRLLPINLIPEIDVHFSFVKYSPCLPIWPLLHPLNKPVIILATVLFQEWVQSFTWLASLLACVYDMYLCANAPYSTLKLGGKSAIWGSQNCLNVTAHIHIFCPILEARTM